MVPAMKLRTDVTVWRLGCSIEDLADRIEVASHGCGCPADGIRHRYDDGARVPCGAWRSATSEELDALLPGDGTTDLRRTIALVSSPSVVLHAFSPLKSVLQRYGRLAPALSWAASQPGRKAVDDATRELRRLGTVARVLGVDARPAGLVTSTVGEPPNYPFVGLHCDSYERRAFPDPELDPLRFCVNLGDEPRHFVFFNRRVSLLRAAMDGEFQSVYDVVRAHLLSESTGPVFRVRIDPDEAYLAPTFDLIHDASTEGRKSPDLTFSALGLFDPRRFQ